MRNTLSMLVCAALAMLPACTQVNRIACAGGSLPPPVTVSLVYPIDGATAVPDNPGSIVFQKPTGGAQSGVQLVLTPPAGPQIMATPGPVPSPLPTPNTPPSPGDGLLAFPVPALAAATTYEASVRGTVTFPGELCGPSGISGGGSFTTR